MEPYDWYLAVSRFARTLQLAVDSFHSIADSIETLFLRIAIVVIFIFGLCAIGKRLLNLGHEFDAKPQQKIMKNYYYNPKTRDLMIFDAETKEMMVLERIEGIRVVTSSEIDRPGGDEPVKKWRNSDWDPEAGRARYGRRPTGDDAPRKKCGYCHETTHRGKDCPNKAPVKSYGELKTIEVKRVMKCKNCGKPGHFAKTCPKAAAAEPTKLPDAEVEKIVREERTETDANSERNHPE
jgi:Zinc knuckle